jgi:predicted nucleic acid-binding protein
VRDPFEPIGSILHRSTLGFKARRKRARLAFAVDSALLRLYLEAAVPSAHEKYHVRQVFGNVFTISSRWKVSAYEGAYLVAAEELDNKVWTEDRAFYTACDAKAHLLV